MSKISSLALSAGTCALHASGTGEWSHLTGRRVTAPGIALGRGLQSQHDAVMISMPTLQLRSKECPHRSRAPPTCESDYSFAVILILPALVGQLPDNNKMSAVCCFRGVFQLCTPHDCLTTSISTDLQSETPDSALAAAENSLNKLSPAQCLLQRAEQRPPELENTSFIAAHPFEGAILCG